MEVGYRFRIYPNKKQLEQIVQGFGHSRHVYNYYLGLLKEQYDSGEKVMSFAECCRDLTRMKKEEKPWLSDVDSTSLQASVKTVFTARQNFFDGIKAGRNVGYPHFKSKRDSRQSYKSKNNGETIALYDGCIKLPKLGYVKCRVSKKVQGRIISATVEKAPSGKYFVAVCCTGVEIPQPKPTGREVGLDLGLKDFCITSDAEKYENHKYLDKSAEKLAKLQRELSRKQKGSRNYEKARVKVARQYEKIANQRNDALHKLSTSLVREYDVICVETLAVKNMVKNKNLAKSIYDASWSEFVRQLTYKCEWYGKELVRISRSYPSSQLCHACGYKNPAVKDLKIREWVCPHCKTLHDRDVNAAINTLNEGLRLLDIREAA